jgi:hypothetical protein
VRKHFGGIAKWLAKLNFPSAAEMETAKPPVPLYGKRSTTSGRPSDVREPVAWIDKLGDCYDRKGRLLSP